MAVVVCFQAAWAAREKELQDEQQAVSKKLRLQADLSHKADQAAQAKVSHQCNCAHTICGQARRSLKEGLL